MTGKHMINRRPRLKLCPRCKRNELLGIDEGLPYRVEPVPITLEAEILAAMGKRRCYGVDFQSCLTYRDAFRIRGDGVRHARPIVFTQHSCWEYPQPSHIDIAHVPTVRRLMETVWSEDAETSEESDHDQAVITIADVLDGRVVKDGDASEAPF